MKYKSHQSNGLPTATSGSRSEWWLFNLTGNVMNNDLMKFSFEDKSFRTINKGGNVMFCLADLCHILGLEKVSQVKSRLRKDGVFTIRGGW